MRVLFFVFLFMMPVITSGQQTSGYYRYPAIHKDLIIFTAEGDLWKVSSGGGVAYRLTTHLGSETQAAISSDGTKVAFIGEYEGKREIYIMPVGGGLPERMTFNGENESVVGWTSAGSLLYRTREFSTLPNQQLVALDTKTGQSKRIPLNQASDGVYDTDNTTLFFTRLPFQGSRTKRYKGGTAQNIWKYVNNSDEAKPLTADYPGTSKNPMYWQNRIYFLSDRDGTMNIWSMAKDGRDLKQHTYHKGFDVSNPDLYEGKIVYQCVADLYLYDISLDQTTLLEIQVTSDFEQQREKWVKKPMDYLSCVHLSPDGEHVVLTSRGQVFVAPAQSGRLVRLTHRSDIRHRNALYMPDDKTILMMSDESGELEFYTVPANGLGPQEALTNNGNVFRFAGIPSPDGKKIAFKDKNYQLWIHDIAKQKTIKIATSDISNFYHLSWSPDSKWLAYVASADNYFSTIILYHTEDKKSFPLTSERVDSYDPVWSPDGKYLYFLSDRYFNSLVRSPWGARQPEPFFDKTTKLYVLPLLGKDKSPFLPVTELDENGDDADKAQSSDEKKKEKINVQIDFKGIHKRIQEIPVAAGAYSDLSANDKYLYFIDRETSVERIKSLKVLEIKKTDIGVKSFVERIDGYEMSADGKKILVRRKDDLYVVDAAISAPSDMNKHKIDLKNWTFSINPGDEWRQMFVEAWRLERDYFYDPQMHGVDYQKLLDKYLPYINRVTDRAELSDLIAHLVGELSALHIYVFGGDFRKGSDDISIGSLGARLIKDDILKGYRVDHIYQADPDYPDRWSPLAKPEVNMHEGDVIMAINGQSLEKVKDPQGLLKNQVGEQVLLSIKSKDKNKDQVIVKPISARAEYNLRYNEWKLQRRQKVDELGNGEIGYVHLRAMGGYNITEWVENFYPVYNRKGLIIDVRHNRGGNIDSWILEKLLRKAWFYWKDRVGQPYWNMQYSFRGHMVVLCNEHTASDGEAFTEGFRRLGLGKVIGTRTWGGEIWLSYNNRLVDKGIASAAQIGVYGPEGKWLIEGHGVEPDIVVDNLPHATFKGRDAQLEAAVKYLKEKIKQQPVEIPVPPPYPDKSYDYDQK